MSKEKIFQNKTTTHTHTQRHTKTSSSSSQRYKKKKKKNNNNNIDVYAPVRRVVDFINAVDAFMDRNGAEFNAYVLSI